MAEKAKYIDVKELSIVLDIMRNPDSEFATDDYIDGFSDGISAAIKELEAFPTADVAPVRHGHWIDWGGFGSLYNGFIPEYKCSVCNSILHSKRSYCGNCGAKMDGGEEND